MSNLAQFDHEGIIENQRVKDHEVQYLHSLLFQSTNYAVYFMFNLEHKNKGTFAVSRKQLRTWILSVQWAVYTVYLFIDFLEQKALCQYAVDLAEMVHSVDELLYLVLVRLHDVA